MKVIIGTGYPSPRSLNGGNGLFGSPLDLDIDLGAEAVHPFTGQIEAKLIEVWSDAEQFGATEAGHVNGGAGVYSSGVYHQLELAQTQRRKLSLVPQRVVVGPLETDLPLDGRAA